MVDTMALVLSGGGGEPLSVLTVERAVSAVPFGGKYRVIDFVLTNLSHSGVRHVGVLSQHVPTSLHDHIGSGRPWDLDRRSGGVRMLTPYQTRTHSGWYRGTADAIAQNWDSIEEVAPERVLALSGDHVYRMDYRQLIHTHRERRAAVTLAVTRVPVDQSRRFGMAEVDGEGRLTSLVEKPERASTPFASMGIYLFESEVLGEWLRGHPVDLVLDVVRPMIEAGERVYTHEFDGYWEDVGAVPSYYSASLELLAPEPRLLLHDPRWPILTRDEERPPVLVLDGAQVEDSLVANGCRVSGRVSRSLLFPGVRIEPGAEVVDSIVMSDTVIERGAAVHRSILDKYVRVERDAVVGWGEPPANGATAWLEGVTLVGKEAVIPAGVRVGRASVIGVGTVPSDYAGERVEAGSQLPSRPWFKDVS